jgi:hypothetical protein
MAAMRSALALLMLALLLPQQADAKVVKGVFER